MSNDQLRDHQLRNLRPTNDHRPDDHRPNDHRPDDHLPNDHRPDDHLPNDHRPDDHLPNDHRPDDHRPDDRTLDRPTFDWQTVDRALRTIAKRRAALDAEEARWLREAEALQIWRPLGMVSMLDYLERVMGYAPRTAQERLRVAHALESLPQLTAALADGTLLFSAVRELTRVATPETEAAWCNAAAGKTVRQMAELVADHHPGDSPDDPPDPQARIHVVRYELSAESFALLRQARQALDDEHGTNLADEEFVAALCSTVLDGALTTEPTGRAKFQVAITLCSRCRQGWQEGGGAQVPIDDTAVERAMCDAQHIGSLDGDVPERAHQDIPPSVARLVWRRDGGRCRVDGCRSSRGLELHHLVHRADGGSHDASNIVLTCGSCHRAHHRGALTISGTAEHLEVRRAGETMRPANPVTLDGVEVPGCPDVDANFGNVTATTSAHVGGHKASCSAAGLHSDEAGRVAPFNAAEPSSNVVHHVAAFSATLAADEIPMVPFSAAGLNGEGNRVASLGDTGASVRARGRSENQPAIATPATDGPVNQLERAVRREEATAALIGLGWKPAIARAALAGAIAALPPAATLEQLIREALRRCPRSSAMTERAANV